MNTIKRIEERDTGKIYYMLDDGSPQLIGTHYETREAAEAAAALGRLKKKQAKAD